jgi:hypothetical protein
MADHEVASEGGVREVMHCATHPQVESYLRCSRCEKPICPRCMIQTPVGARCRECARLQRLPTFDARPRDLAFGLAAGAGAGLLGGALLALPLLRAFSLLLTLVLGYAVGQAVLAAANRRRATSLAALAAGCTLIGAIYGPLLLVALSAPQVLAPGMLVQVFLRAVMSPLELLLIGLAALIAWYQVR